MNHIVLIAGTIALVSTGYAAWKSYHAPKPRHTWECSVTEIQESLMKGIDDPECYVSPLHRWRFFGSYEKTHNGTKPEKVEMSWVYAGSSELRRGN